MKKLLHLLIVELVVVAALAAVLIALVLNPPQRGGETYVFSAHSVTDITSVQVENENGSFAITMQDGGYVISDVPAELVDVDTFIEFLTACSEVSALQKVDSSQNELEEYGLAEPLSQVNVTFADGSALSLTLGSQEPVSGNYYCTVDGENGVYLLPAETAQWYLFVKESFISFYVTPEMTVSSALSAVLDVTFSGGPLEHPVTIESVSAGDEEVKQLARSFGAATHIVRSAGVFELDQTYGLTMLTPLCGMVGQSIYYYGLTEEQEDAMGFAEPYMQVEFDYKNGTEEPEHIVLRFLPATEDGSFFYVNAKGSGMVYLVERQAFMDLEYEKLLLRWFISPLLMDITGMTVESGGQVYFFAVDNTDVKNPVVTLNGAPVDVDLFRSFFRLTCSAASDGDYLGPDTDPSGSPSMRITYHYSEGKSDDVMELYPGDTRRVNVYVNGVCEFAMKDTFVERVQQALTAIQAGETFDANW